MKKLNLRNYTTTEEFIQAVEETESWDSIPKEDYEEALTEAGLDYNSYDDPDKMWDDFLKAVK